MDGLYRFQEGPVDETLVQDVRALDELTEEQLGEIVGVVLEFLSSADSAVLVDGAERFSEKHGTSAGALRPSLLGLILVFKGAARRHLSRDLVGQDMARFGLGPAKAEVVASLWGKYVASLSRSMAQQTVSANRLVDLEWRFGVTAASSEVESVGRTFVQVALQLDAGEGGREDRTIELTLPQFYEFLREMERARACMGLVSG